MLSNKTIKILLLGELYSNNFGDGVICETVKKIIETEIPNVEIKMVDLSCRKNYPMIRKDTKIVTKEKWFKKLLHKSLYITYNLQIFKKKKIIKEACNGEYDLAIFAGGNLFMDYFVMYIATFINYLAKKNVPIIFNACGAGNIKDKLLLKKLRKALKYENIISASSRDDFYKINSEYFQKDFAKKTCDPALCNEIVYNIKPKESNVIGLGIMKVRDISYNEIIDFWVNIVNKLEKIHLNWQFFCNGETGDYELAREIIKKIGKDEEKYLAKQPKQPGDLVETISQYEKIISFRLHSHIIAYSLQIPSIAFEWDPKVRSFFKDIGHEENCFKFGDKMNIVEKINLLQYDNRDKNNLEKMKSSLEEILKNDINNAIRRKEKIEN